MKLQLCLTVVLIIVAASFVHAGEDEQEQRQTPTPRRKVVPKSVYGCQDPRAQSEGLKWNASEQLWMYPPTDSEAAQSCEAWQRPFRTRGELVEALNGKHLLFVGDSTVRNIMKTLIAMICNPTWMDECSQHHEHPFQTCNAEKYKNRTEVYNASEKAIGRVEDEHMRNYGEVVDNTCQLVQDGGDIWMEEVELVGLTERTLYKSGEERKRLFWTLKRIPPMYTHILQNVTITMLEGACIQGGNSVVKELKWVHQNLKEQWENGTQDTRRTGPWRYKENQTHYRRGNIPANFDVLITSAALHCSRMDFMSGAPEEEKFYGAIPYWLRRIRQDFGKPVIWNEISYIITAKKQQLLKAYRSRIMAQLEPDGPKNWDTAIPISPTFFLTLNSRKTVKTEFMPDTEREMPCVFFDPTHPTVRCYRALTMTAVKSMLMIMKRPLVAMIGTKGQSTDRPTEQPKESTDDAAAAGSGNRLVAAAAALSNRKRARDGDSLTAMREEIARLRADVNALKRAQPPPKTAAPEIEVTVVPETTPDPPTTPAKTPETDEPKRPWESEVPVRQPKRASVSGDFLSLSGIVLVLVIGPCLYYAASRGSTVSTSKSGKPLQEVTRPDQ